MHRTRASRSCLRNGPHDPHASTSSSSSLPCSCSAERTLSRAKRLVSRRSLGSGCEKRRVGEADQRWYLPRELILVTTRRSTPPREFDGIATRWSWHPRQRAQRRCSRERANVQAACLAGPSSRLPLRRPPTHPPTHVPQKNPQKPRSIYPFASARKLHSPRHRGDDAQCGEHTSAD